MSWPRPSHSSINSQFPPSHFSTRSPPPPPPPAASLRRFNSPLKKPSNIFSLSQTAKIWEPVPPYFTLPQWQNQQPPKPPPQRRRSRLRWPSNSRGGTPPCRTSSVGWRPCWGWSSSPSSSSLALTGSSAAREIMWRAGKATAAWIWRLRRRLRRSFWWSWLATWGPPF